MAAADKRPPENRFETCLLKTSSRWGIGRKGKHVSQIFISMMMFKQITQKTFHFDL